MISALFLSALPALAAPQAPPRIDLSEVRLPRALAIGDEPLLGDRTQRFTVVVFVSAQCPCSNGYVGRLRELAREFSGARGVRFVGVFANQNEAPGEVAQYAARARFPFVALRDPGALVADRLSASVTPEAFVFDPSGAVRYHGRIDDSLEAVGVTRRELHDALDALLAGREPAPGGRAFGCGIVRGAVRTDADLGWKMVHAMRGLTGPWTMRRESSGTAWLPDAAPLFTRAGKAGGWETMWHGYHFLTTAFNDNPTRLPRRAETFGTGWGMGMARRALGDRDAVGVRAMLASDPLFVPRRGYPLPFQTGETAYGRPLVDRQHPHDFVMELAATYSHLLSASGSGASVFAYVAPVGEPALGPPAFVHRPSAYDNPEAPLGHHWLDSTHIASGVVTLGLATHRAKIEGSVFTGRAPDEHRFAFDPIRMDSYSGRVSVNPSRELSLSASHAFLKRPEATDLYTHQHRTILSAAYSRDRWHTTLAYGSLKKLIPVLADGRHLILPGLNYNFVPAQTPAYLLESSLLQPGYSVFGRIEQVDKDELFPDNLVVRTYRVRKFTLGGVRNLGARQPGRDDLGIGASVSLYAVPSALRLVYGRAAPSFTVFLRWRTGAAPEPVDQP